MIKNVLVIDDNPDILDVVKDFLELYGIPGNRVFTSLDPFEGLEIFRKNKDSISLVICDYYMPKSNGPELCEILKKNSPGLFVILQTGDMSIKLEDLDNVDFLLHKPYNYEAFELMLNFHKFESEPPQYKRSEPREVGGRFQMAILKLGEEGPFIHGAVSCQSPPGVGMALTSGTGLEMGQQLEVILGEYKSASNQYQLQKPRKAKIAWIKVINIDTYKVGLEFQE